MPIFDVKYHLHLLHKIVCEWKGIYTMKRFISLINKSIPFGRGLNALAHTAVGIGHACPEGSLPSIEIFFADTETIRAFRNEVHRIMSEHPKDAVCSEFTDTMTVGDTPTCLKVTSETSESQLKYYAVSICANDALLQSPQFRHILNICSVLKNYEPYNMGGDQRNFEFQKHSLPDYQSLPTHKMALILDKTMPFAELVNATAMTSFEMGKKAHLDQLRLLIYVDASGEKHPYISYHAFPILAAKKQEKFKELTAQIENDSRVLSSVIRKHDGTVIGACMLGSDNDVNAYTYQKFISFWTMELSPDAFLK